MSEASSVERKEIDRLRKILCGELPGRQYSKEELRRVGFQNSGNLLTEEDKKLIHKVGEEASELQWEYRGCPQTTLKALQDNLGIGDAGAFKAASALAGGGAGLGKGYCGALVGGLMALGLEFGRADFDEKGSPRRGQGGESPFKTAFDLGKELVRSFEKVAYGEHSCNGIQMHCFGRPLSGAVIDHPEVKKGMENGYYWSMIAEEARVWTEVAARLTTEIILRERRKRSST